MKKAVAFIDKAALIALLKIPYQVDLVGIEYPAKNDRVKIVLQGEPLPVKKSSPNSKRLPEIKYTVMNHWHQAKMEPKELKKNED